MSSVTCHESRVTCSWWRLVEPTVRMCREGIPVSWTAAAKLRWYGFNICRGSNIFLARHIFLTRYNLTQEAMRRVFLDPRTGAPWREGDTYTRPALARTLTQLAEAGDRGEADLGFYTGSIGRDLVADLEAAGGIITQADLASYRHTCSGV